MLHGILDTQSSFYLAGTEIIPGFSLDSYFDLSFPYAITPRLSKSIDMRFHWLQDRIQRNQFHVEHVAGRDNIADFFTKALPRIKHQQFAPFCAVDRINP